MPVAAFLMTSAILLFAYVAKALLPGRSITVILGTSVLPPVLAVLDALVRRREEWLRWLQRTSAR
jgi:hypothetical protein